MTYRPVQRSSILKQQQQQQKQQGRSTLDSHYSKPFYSDGKLRQHMGSSASSNNATPSAGTGSHRGSLPSTLPGGNDWYVIISYS